MVVLSKLRVVLSSMCLGLTGGMLVTSGALAQPAVSSISGMRSVLLKNGAIYRGELVELVPSDHIILKLATGEVKRFEWADITPDGTTEQTVTIPQSKPEPGIAGVHIVSTDPRAILERQTGTRTITDERGFSAILKVWEPVCRSPCDVAFERVGYFSIRGNGINPSEEFTLPVAGPLTLKVKAGRRSIRMASVAALIVAGLGGIVPSVSMFAIGATQCNLLSCDVPAQRMRATATANSMYLGGGISLALGLLLGGLGTAGMILSRTQISVEQN